MVKLVEDFSKDIDQNMTDGRLDAPAARRNHEVIADILTPLLQNRSGHLVEIGSGTGQHAVVFAQHFPDLIWWPTDPVPAHRTSIDAWRAYTGIGNIMPAMDVDASGDWDIRHPEHELKDRCAAVYTANVIHISPWKVAQGIIRGASEYLGADGLLIFYGPFARNGDLLSQGNVDFDVSLRARNPDWGVRDVADVTEFGQQNGLEQRHVFDMPSNNTILVLGNSDQATPRCLLSSLE